MIVHFRDGPAAGKTLNLPSSPELLRVTVDSSGRFDGLDQPHDTPRADERIYVYRLVKGSELRAVACGRHAGCGCSSIESCSYTLWTEQPPENVLRDNELWREYCDALKEYESDM